ncbi:MAG TPA: hypothetical protein VGN23_06865 [Verrucomicrobiae bacterium]|jgi:hypothetical protein
MNKYYALFILHLLFWLAVIIPMAFFDLSVTVFGKHMPFEAVLVVVCLPLLVIISWRASKNAPIQSLKNYFWTFRWIGIVFWVFTLIMIWASNKSPWTGSNW